MLLLKEQDFKLTTESEISAAGRFYVHLTTTLSNQNSLYITLLNVFKCSESDFITTEGLTGSKQLKNNTMF